MGVSFIEKHYVFVVWMYSDRMVPNGCRSRMCNQTFDLNVNIVLSGEATI